MRKHRVTNKKKTKKQKQDEKRINSWITYKVYLTFKVSISVLIVSFKFLFFFLRDEFYWSMDTMQKSLLLVNILWFRNNVQVNSFVKKKIDSYQQ